MALTKAELVDRVTDNTGRNDKDTLILSLLNDALRIVATRHDWLDLYREFESTLDEDDFRYSFPSDMKTLIGIRLISGTESEWLEERDKRWLMEREPNPDDADTEKPWCFARDGNYWELPAKPDDDYTVYINYVKWPDDLSNDDDTPDIDQIDHVLIEHATARLYASLGEFDRAAWWTSEWRRDLKEAIVQDRSRPGWRPQFGESTRHPGSYWLKPEYG